MSWVAAADYRRANSRHPAPHPCQVYGKVEHVDSDLMIGAIASGDAKSSLSHIGAKIAVRAALSHLKEQAPAVRYAVAVGSNGPARSLYLDTFELVLERLRAAAFDHVASIKGLATTLTIFSVEPRGVASMQIGDGLIVARGPDSDYRLIFGQSEANAGLEASFVTNDNAVDAMRVDVHAGPINFLCAASKAVGALSIRPRDGKLQKRFFKSLNRHIGAAPDDSEVHRGIRSFLRSDYINERMNEDLGIALCGYRAQGELFSAAAE